ncbi:hypothetical protein GCM10023206_18840 [Acinetobacter puyangensis]|uniref:Zinc carboxypeptidase n=1 Tax=Acinetobacter puyangensis TaxID=1096779 RepID=A0A240E514_9GAMM|nr:M14 family metallopeptidase [Acinetobacter puyangensis]SNX43854.1 Zinc carboxypeptidase [Acinetobacter puyangensis]
MQINDHAWYNMSNDSIRLSSRDMLKLVYNFYDQLTIDFPNHITMNLLGTDMLGNEIREYVLSPFGIGKMSSAPISINKFPQLLIVTGQHGQEISSTIAVMLLCDELLRKFIDNDVLSAIRTSFSLRIIPAINSSGTKNNQRRNHNGVDLNRNFPNGWENAGKYKGKKPLSEIENQILVNWINRHKKDSMCFINLHDHSDLALTWGCASHNWSQKILFKSFQKLAVWYHKKFDNLVDGDLTWLGVPRDGYSDKYIGNDLGLPTILVECPYINHARLSNEWIDIRLTNRQILICIFDTLIKYYQNTF